LTTCSTSTSTYTCRSSKWEDEAKPLPLDVLRREEEARRARRAASPPRGSRRAYSPVHRRPYSPPRRYSPARRDYSPAGRGYSPLRRGHSPARPDLSPPRRAYSPPPREFGRRPPSPVHRPCSPPPYGAGPSIPGATLLAQYLDRRYLDRRQDLVPRGGRGYSPPPRAAGLPLPGGRPYPSSYHPRGGMDDRWAPDDRYDMGLHSWTSQAVINVFCSTNVPTRDSVVKDDLSEWSKCTQPVLVCAPGVVWCAGLEWRNAGGCLESKCCCVVLPSKTECVQRISTRCGWHSVLCNAA
jgi:hypothetical protein